MNLVFYKFRTFNDNYDIVKILLRLQLNVDARNTKMRYNLPILLTNNRIIGEDHAMGKP